MVLYQGQFFYSPPTQDIWQRLETILAVTTEHLVGRGQGRCKRELPAPNGSSAEVEKLHPWCSHAQSDRWNSVWQSELIVLLLFDPLYVCVWNWNENILETTPISLHTDCYFSSSNPLDLKAYCVQDTRFVIRVKRWNMFLPLSFKIKKDRPP